MIKGFLTFLMAIMVIASLVNMTGCKGKEEAQVPAEVEQPSQFEDRAPEATEEAVPEEGSPETQSDQGPAQPGEKP